MKFINEIEMLSEYESDYASGEEYESDNEEYESIVDYIMTKEYNGYSEDMCVSLSPKLPNYTKPLTCEIPLLENTKIVLGETKQININKVEEKEKEKEKEDKKETPLQKKNYIKNTQTQEKKKKKSKRVKKNKEKYNKKKPVNIFTLLDEKEQDKEEKEKIVEILTPKMDFYDLNKKEEDIKKMRTMAFELFSSKEDMAKHLYKTKMCRNKECSNPNCTFAHSIDELKPATCRFGEFCKFRFSSIKKCGFLHPGETKEEFVSRTTNTTMTENIKPVVLQLKPQTFDNNQFKELETIDTSKTWSDIVKKEKEKEIEKQDEVTLIKAPKELAIQSMEKALQMGVKNIHIIVE